ncbi:mucin-1-like [Vidua macroura]|uniref:mucin-1-like n=1 Tax=Vidua macroura TaxID=187451 RepID=UPI0023A81217|nr:mucin-1-like [Vidua macroura]
MQGSGFQTPLESPPSSSLLFLSESACGAAMGEAPSWSSPKLGSLTLGSPPDPPSVAAATSAPAAAGSTIPSPLPVPGLRRTRLPGSRGAPSPRSPRRPRARTCSRGARGGSGGSGRRQEPPRPGSQAPGGERHRPLTPQQEPSGAPPSRPGPAGPVPAAAVREVGPGGGRERRRCGSAGLSPLSRSPSPLPFVALAAGSAPGSAALRGSALTALAGQRGHSEPGRGIRRDHIHTHLAHTGTTQGHKEAPVTSLHHISPEQPSTVLPALTGLAPTHSKNEGTTGRHCFNIKILKLQLEFHLCSYKDSRECPRESKAVPIMNLLWTLLLIQKAFQILKPAEIFLDCLNQKVQFQLRYLKSKFLDPVSAHFLPLEQEGTCFLWSLCQTTLPWPRSFNFIHHIPKVH